jgi:hypothetical protein
MTGNDHGEILLFGNLEEGISGSLTLIDGNFGQIDAGNRSAPSLADLNSDKKLDLAIGNLRGGLELFTTEIVAGTTSTHDIADDIEKPYEFHFDIANSTLTITWKIQSGTWVLYDLYGRALHQSVESTVTTDLSGLLPGIYFVQVTYQGHVWVEKIVRK